MARAELHDAEVSRRPAIKLLKHVSSCQTQHQHRYGSLLLAPHSIKHGNQDVQYSDFYDLSHGHAECKSEVAEGLYVVKLQRLKQGLLCVRTSFHASIGFLCPLRASQKCRHSTVLLQATEIRYVTWLCVSNLTYSRKPWISRFFSDISWCCSV